MAGFGEITAKQIQAAVRDWYFAAPSHRGVGQVGLGTNTSASERKVLVENPMSQAFP